MIWILHILAAVFFFPALFVTIPAHMLLNRVPPKVSPEGGPHDPSDPTKRQLTSGQEVAFALAFGAVLWVLQAVGLL